MGMRYRIIERKRNFDRERDADWGKNDMDAVNKSSKRKSRVRKYSGLCMICAGLLVASMLVGCGKQEIPGGENSLGSMEGSISSSAEEEAYVYILPEGMTLETRFATPEGYVRTSAGHDSLSAFLRNYELKKDGAPVLLHHGAQKGSQDHHAAVFDMELVSGDLQQCADSVMRVWAEYYWSVGQQDKIAFHFSSGDLCSWTKWRDGYRPNVSGNSVSFEKRASYNDSYENFVRYLETIFSYAGTLSMDSYESETIALSELQVGDVFLKGGSPGHVVMVVDMCENEDGERAFLLAQGYMPAQEFHVIKNPAHEEDPWYYESEIQFPFRTMEYTFEDESMIKRLAY